MTTLVRGCLESDFDAGTGTCAQEVWIPQPAVFPQLSVEDAMAIGLAVAKVLAVAFVFRILRKFINQAN